MSQLRTLLWVTAQDVLREGVDAGTGARATPVKHLAFSMGLIGLVTGLAATRHPDLASFSVQLSATCLWLCALVVMPDPLDLREKKLELVRSKPVPAKVLMQARVLSLLLITTLVVVFLSVPALAVAVPRLGGSWQQAAGIVAALATGAFAAVLLWLALAFLLARRIGIPGVRWLSQAVLVSSIAAVMAVATLLPHRAAALATHPLVRVFPSTWFARLPFGAPALEWLLAGALVATAVIAHVTVDVDRCYDRGLAAMDPPARLGLMPRAASWVARHLLPAPTSGVADLVLLVNAREEMSRIRAFAPRLVQIGAAAGALALDDPLMPIALLGGYGLLCVAEGLAAAARSAQPQASWLLLAAPVAPARLTSGLAWAVLAREATLPASLLVIVLLVCRPFAAAAVLVAAFALAAVAVTGLLLFLAPRVPLGSEQKAWPGLAGFLGLNVLGTACAVGFALMVALTSAGTFGTMIAGAALVPLALVAGVLAWLASRRTPVAEGLV